MTGECEHGGRRVFRQSGITHLVAKRTRGRRARAVPAGAFEVATFLCAVDRVVAAHRAVGDAVAVAVEAALDQHARPEEVARGLHGRHVAVQHLRNRTTSK